MEGGWEVLVVSLKTMRDRRALDDVGRAISEARRVVPLLTEEGRPAEMAEQEFLLL